MSDDTFKLTQQRADTLKVGRPSTYDPRYCEIVLEAGARGESEVGMAVACGVPRVTMRGWAKQHEEFSTALLMAKDLSQKWWEDAARSGHAQSVIGPTIWRHSVASRFREDYGERQVIEQTVRDAKDMRQMTDAEIEAEIRALNEQEEKRQRLMDQVKSIEDRIGG